MKLENAKGTKDYEPREKMVRDKLLNTLVKIFERYGFNPLETPILERYDILSMKYAGGSEILKETYKLQDQGNRKLCLRYDLTVPFARFMGMNPNLKMPFKRYQIGPVFRDGPIKKGRFRQFYQADVDVVGTASVLADAEFIKLALDAFKELGIDVSIKVNNRKVLNAMINKSGIPENLAESAILSLDKLEKIGRAGVLQEMQEKGIESGSKLLEIATSVTLKTIQELLPDDEGMKEILEMFSAINNEKVFFVPTLARGLAYYTGPVFEVFSEDLDVSLAGGGRYDDMIGAMIGRGEYPATGISFGVDTIVEILKEKSEAVSVSKLLVIPIGIRKEADEVTQQLRDAGINTETDLVGRGISKNLDFANSYKIPYVLFIGKQEVEQGKFKLKDMKSGEEELLSVEEIIEKLSK